jgi:hypothetical protein
MVALLVTRKLSGVFDAFFVRRFIEATRSARRQHKPPMTGGSINGTPRTNH